MTANDSTDDDDLPSLDDMAKTLHGSIGPRELFDQRDATHSGLTDVQPNIRGGVGSSKHVRISRASTTGAHRRLTGKEAIQAADEIRELAAQDSVLLEYFLAGKDDADELADALENAGILLEAADMLNDGALDPINAELKERYLDEVQDDE